MIGASPGSVRLPDTVIPLRSHLQQTIVPMIPLALYGLHEYPEKGYQAHYCLIRQG